MSKTVLITGASSGIGRACVLRMRRSGWRVFAAVRKSSDLERIQSRGDTETVPVMMNMEDESSIRSAAEQLRSQLEEFGLDGLVNVAGIGMVRPIEYASLRDLRQIFEINVFGHFFRELRQARGRIVNITSVGVNLAIPFGGLLNASKSAFGMLSDTLRLELRPFGIRVLAIEPGAISTPAVDKTLGDIEQVIENLPPDGRKEYGIMLRNFAKQAYGREKNGSSPDVVARAVYNALTSSRPRLRYRVGKHAKALAVLPRILPEPLLDSLRLRLFGLNPAPEHAERTRKNAAAQRLSRKPGLAG
jgi:NAD(P)-dependent dehydrogenase (short-subunit alcohol dehydrogenase family)